ncbi:hypothetical protein J3F83DRAFT_592211 [Trichoderma novae-zelandiae]
MIGLSGIYIAPTTLQATLRFHQLATLRSRRVSNCLQDASPKSHCGLPKEMTPMVTRWATRQWHTKSSRVETPRLVVGKTGYADGHCWAAYCDAAVRGTSSHICRPNTAQTRAISPGDVDVDKPGSSLRSSRIVHQLESTMSFKFRFSYRLSASDRDASLVLQPPPSHGNGPAKWGANRMEIEPHPRERRPKCAGKAETIRRQRLREPWRVDGRQLEGTWSAARVLRPREKTRWRRRKRGDRMPQIFAACGTSD